MSQCRTLQKVDSISKTFSCFSRSFPMGNCWFMPHLLRIFMILRGFVRILCANRVGKQCTPSGLRLDSCSCSPSIAVPRHQACHGTGHTQLTEVIKQLCGIPFVRGFWGWRNLPVENLPFCLRGAVLSFCFFKLKSYNMYNIIYIYMDFWWSWHLVVQWCRHMSFICSNVSHCK